MRKHLIQGLVFTIVILLLFLESCVRKDPVIIDSVITATINTQSVLSSGVANSTNVRLADNRGGQWNNSTQNFTTRVSKGKNTYWVGIAEDPNTNHTVVIREVRIKSTDNDRDIIRSNGSYKGSNGIIKGKVKWSGEPTDEDQYDILFAILDVNNNYLKYNGTDSIFVVDPKLKIRP